MTRKLVSLSVIVALLCAVDAPAVLFQGAAWASMMARGLRGGSISRTVTETFDGRHPCAMCRRVRVSAPEQSLSAARSPRVDLFPPVAGLPRSSAALTPEPSTRLIAANSRSAAPPVPPPDRRNC